MSGWIKFDKDMALDPRLVTAATKLRKRRLTTPVTPLHFYCNALRGALVTLWCYADEHIHDDDTLQLTSEAIDTVVNLEGFFEVVPRVWVTELDDGRIKLPGYCEKNGLITKRKRTVKSNARVANWRARKAQSSNAGVTHDETQFNCGLDQDLDQDHKNKKSSSNSIPQQRDDGPVVRVFEHWKAVWQHPRAKLDPKRRRVIATALKAYSEADLRACITGYLNSSHHCGENERRAVYDDIGLFLRDAARIDAGVAFGQDRTNGPAKPKLTFHREEEFKAYEAATKQGLTFASQDEWEAHYRGRQTH